LPAMLLQTKKCAGSLKTGLKKNSNVVSGILLVILPKCPFCIMAYSGTIMLCGKDTLIEKQFNHISPLSIALSAFFCLIIIGGLLLNYRGSRTRYALGLSALGTMMVMQSVAIGGGQQLYYPGVAILFIAVWLNGSLLSILRKINHAAGLGSKAATEKSCS
jgi:hypothetical protein